MEMSKYGIAALALALVSLIVPTYAFAGAVSDPTAVETTLKVTFSPPPGWTNPFAGTAQLFTGTTGNLIPLGGTFSFLIPAVQTDTVVQMLGDVSTAACWIALGGDTTVNAISIPIFAFAPGTSTDGLPTPTSAPIVSTGMTDGSFVLTSSGPIIGFDIPEVVGTWTLTEAPITTPEPSSLSLVLVALGCAGILTGIRRKRLVKTCCSLIAS